jgi:hypothetical protein
LWREAEQRYDAGKLECWALLCAVKRFRHYLYGVHFLVEIDAKTIIHQLNEPINDIPGAVIGRWLTYIRLFSFDIVHVPSMRHKGLDVLSRWPAMAEETAELAGRGRSQAEEIEEFINAELDFVRWEKGVD